MGREVKRIDIDFDWYEKTKSKEEKDWREKIWIGYVLDIKLLCPLCDGEGKNTKEKSCPLCWGERYVTPTIEPPFGSGWQMWEDTTEGSPISPVFKTAVKLAEWLEENGASAMGSQTATKEQWLKMIKVGSAPSGAMIGGRMMSGVEAVGKD